MSRDIRLTVEIGNKKYGAVVSEETARLFGVDKVAEELSRMLTTTLGQQYKENQYLEEIND